MTENALSEADPPYRAFGLSTWQIRLVLLLFSTFLSIIVAELMARAFWRLGHGVPFRNPGRILYGYYPELNQVDREQPSHGDSFYDILLLGGSTLHRDWSVVEQALHEQLAYAGRRNVRIFNLAMPAHTSRDSWLKYASLGNARFELVILYHGINETRVNNIPPEFFREDYSHYSWYEIVNNLVAYHGSASFALPYTLHYLVMRMRQIFTRNRYASISDLREDWIPYGRESRSADSFKNNLSAILELASRRRDQVLLMTFATYLPTNYSVEAFKEKRLDYGLHRSPVEIWGRREHVLLTMAAHNEIVKSLAAQNDHVLFVDQARMMTATGQYFNDPCHFTVLGSSKFVEQLLSGLLPALKRR